MRLRRIQEAIQTNQITTEDFSDSEATCSSDSEITTMQKTEEQFKTKVWTPQENKNLQIGVKKYGEKAWNRIAKEFVPERSGKQCRQRWERTLNPKIKLGKWSEKEDDALREGVMQFGTQWVIIAKECVKTRNCTQCRQRWEIALDTNIKHGEWHKEEDDALREGVMQFGNKWAIIAKECVPKRTGHQCQQRWEITLNTSVSKGSWSKEEDDALREGVMQFGTQWVLIAKECVKTRSGNQCLHHWKTLNSSNKKKSGSVGQKRPRNSYTDTAYESEYQTDNEAKESTSSEPIQEVLPPETECLEKLPTHTRSAAVDTLWGSTFPNIEVYEDDDSPFPKRARVEHSPTMPLPLWDPGLPSASETMQSAYNEDGEEFSGILLEESVTNVNYMLKV